MQEYSVSYNQLDVLKDPRWISVCNQAKGTVVYGKKRSLAVLTLINKLL
jgi:hypothetical protein